MLPGGLGRALVNRILQSNQFNQVVVTGRDIQKIDSRDSRIIPVQLDLLSDQSLVDASTAIASQIDKLNLVVTTAGILKDESFGLKPEKNLQISPGRIWKRCFFSVNCFGPFLWYAALGRLIRHREPITIATLSARVASIGDNRWVVGIVIVQVKPRKIC